MPKREKTYAIIGDPVEHSLSPLIHRFIYQQVDLPYSYQKIKVAPPNLKKFIISCRKNNLQGFNVTIPHKEKIIPLLDDIDKLAQFIGAVNTVTNNNSKLKGFNTDIIGCKRALEKSPWQQTGKVVILGAGGACLSALVALSSFAPSSVILLNRTLERAYKLKKRFSHHLKFDIYVENIKFQEMGDLLSNTSLLINTTPLGMWPQIQNSPIPEPDIIPEHLTVLDMVSNPVYTTLLKQAKKRGAEIISGLSMLISQAIAAQEIWLDRKLPDKIFNTLWTHIIDKMRHQHEQN